LTPEGSGRTDGGRAHVKEDFPFAQQNSYRWRADLAGLF
jgi:hypothetical protein